MAISPVARALETHQFVLGGVYPYKLQVVNHPDIVADEDPWLHMTEPYHQDLMSLRISNRLYKWFFRLARVFIDTSPKMAIVKTLCRTYWDNPIYDRVGRATVKHFDMRWRVHVSGPGIWAEEEKIQTIDFGWHGANGLPARQVRYQFKMSCRLYYWFLDFYKDITGRDDERHLTYLMVVLFNRGHGTLNPMHGNLLPALVQAEEDAIESNRDPMPT